MIFTLLSDDLATNFQCQRNTCHAKKLPVWEENILVASDGFGKMVSRWL
jgi:hypothetical protein